MIKRTLLTALMAALGIGLTGCGEDPASSTDHRNDPVAPHAGHTHAESAVGQFFAAIGEHCGKAYKGQVIKDHPASEPNAFAGVDLVMHVSECGEQEISIPFMVGDDRSRTWVLSRTDGGLRLKHDHRHEDGSSDDVTMYGGDSDDQGSAVRLQFPVDAESIATFERTGLSASVNNTWAMEIEVDKRFLYELSRPSGRLFQVEFDLSQPVPAPPPPWGSDHAADAEPHHHDEHQHGSEAAKLELNQGERWATDDALRQGMERIRTAVAGAPDPLTVDAANALASEIDASVVYLIQNCELEPAADANLHVLLLEISTAAAALKEAAGDSEALAQIHHALDRYPQFFEHAHW